MKKIKQQAPTTYTTDVRGQLLAHVALAGTDQRATLYADDLERVQAAGWSPFWTLVSTGGRNKYVLVNARNPKGGPRSLTVARLIAEAGKGQTVHYMDGDTTNLRRDNLMVKRGTAWTPLAALRPNLSSAPGAQQAPVCPPVKPAETHEKATPHRRHAKPTESHTAPVQTSAPSVPASEPWMPRVIDLAAASARVREQLARQRNAGA